MSSLITKKNVAPAKTAEGAARNMLNAYLQESIERRVEYGGIIYKKGGLHHATGPREGYGNTVNNGPREPNLGCPPGGTPVAYWHTHPTYSVAGFEGKYNEFSDDDKQIARDYGIDAYVGTLDGSFLKYDHKTKQVLRLKGRLKNSDPLPPSPSPRRR